MSTQEERISNAYFIANNLTYADGISREFRAAVKVFKDTLNYSRTNFRGPSKKDLKNLSKNNLDKFDYAFEVKELSFVDFCDIVSSNVFEILNKTIKTDEYRSADFRHYNEWCDFVKHFDEKNFSKLFQKNLLTNNAVSCFEKNGEKRLEIGCDERLLCFIKYFTSNYLKAVIREKV